MSIKNIIINTKCPYARNAKLAKPIRINFLDIYDEMHYYEKVLLSSSIIYLFLSLMPYVLFLRIQNDLFII